MAQMKETVATGESRPKIDVIENENAGYNIKARTPCYRRKQRDELSLVSHSKS
jgi:hypothetical protein